MKRETSTFRYFFLHRVMLFSMFYFLVMSKTALKLTKSQNLISTVSIFNKMLQKDPLNRGLLHKTFTGEKNW